MADRVTVTSADFIRNIGFWQNEAMRRPVVITHHGRDRLILAAPQNFNTDPSGADSAVSRELAALRSAHFAVLDHLDEGMLVIDAQLRVTQANRVALAFCGHDAASILGALLLDVAPQPLASILCDRVQRVLRARKSESLEASTFDDRRVSARVFPMGGAAGVLFHNATETAALRQRLEESDAVASSLARHSLVAAIRLDARARIETSDAAFCALSGFSRAELTGHRFVELAVPQQRRDVAELIERALRDGASGEIALTLLGRCGEEHAGILSVAPISTDFVARGVMAVWAPAAQSETIVETAA